MTRRSLRRTVAALALSATAVAGLAACGDDPDAAAPAAATSESPTATRDEPLDGVELASALTAAYEDVTSARVALSVTGLPGAGSVSAEGVASYGSEAPAVSLTMDVMGQAVELRVVDRVVYLGGPLAGLLGDGTPWVGLDLSTVDLSGLGLDPTRLSASFDPAELAAVIGSAAEVEHAGEQTVDGETLEAYTVTLDPAALAEILPDTGAELPTDEIVVTALVDDADRLRQLSADVPTPAGDAATVTLRLWDYGTAVAVEAPPAAEVTLLEGLPGFTTP